MNKESKMTEKTNLKTLAENFLNLAASGQVDDAYSKYVAPEFIHHNQYFKGDRESLKSGMKENAVKFSNKSFQIKTIVQEGDKVVTHSHVKMNLNDMEIAVFHMFKFKDNKIIEMWDVGQQIAKDSPNKSGMF
jgi:predicted SnoaL-like aldol condensation-catalyzing enzyme